MSTTKTVRVVLAQVEPNGKVLINVVQGVNVDGEVHEGQFENVHSTKDANPKIAAAAKAFLDACADVVAAETYVSQDAVPEVPAVAAVMDGDKEVTPAVAAVPAKPEVRTPRFEGRTVTQ